MFFLLYTVYCILVYCILVYCFLSVNCILYSCILYFELRPPMFYASSYEHYTTLTKKTIVTMWFIKISEHPRHQRDFFAVDCFLTVDCILYSCILFSGCILYIVVLYIVFRVSRKKY